MQNSELRKNIQEAIDSQKNGNIFEALAKYKKIIDKFPENHDAIHLMGLCYHQVGDNENAIKWIEKSFEYNNKNSIAYNNLGTVYSSINQYTQAIKYFDLAIKYDRKYSDAYFNKANAIKNIDSNKFKNIEELYLKAINLNKHHKLSFNNLGVLYYDNKKYEKAINCHLKAIDLDNQYLESYCNLGNNYKAIGEELKAEELYLKILNLNSSYENANLNLTILYKEQKKYDLAEYYALKTLEIDPNKKNINKLLAEIYFEQNKYKESIIFYEKINSIDPQDAEIYNNLGVTYSAINDFKKALTYYKIAISKKQDYAVAYFNMANTYVVLKKFNEALDGYELAINYDNEKENFYNNKGTTLIELKKYKDAIIEFKKAITINKNLAAPYFNIANCSFELGEYKEAELQYEKAIELGIKNEFSGGLPAHMRAQMCIWDSYEADILKIKNNNLQKIKYATPFLASFLFDDLDLLQKTAKLMIQKYQDRIDIRANKVIKKLKNKIKIGYFSSDFKNHPVSFLIVDHLSMHDRNKYEIHAYSYSVSNPDNMTTRIKESVDKFFDVSFLSDQEIIDITIAEELDVAIDLNGYTSSNRTSLFTKGVAPIQIAYLGYLGTMGTESYDYIISDRILIPETSQKYYDEKIIYLPVYQANDRNRKIDLNSINKKDLGISDGVFVFCCFNNNYKINPVIFKVWMEILSEAKNSILLLYEENKYTKINLISEASKFGIAKERIIFTGKIPLEKHLYRYSLCDLFLDTSPYNAGTTASDALWAGLPLITYLGNSFSARMASSILHAHNLSELVTESLSDYKILALKIYNNSEYLNNLKNKVKNKKSSFLFNTPAFTKSFEEAIDKSVKNNLDGSINNIYVDPIFYKEEIMDKQKNDLQIVNFDNPIFWGAREPEIFKDLIKTASKLTGGYHFADNLFVFSRSLSMLRDVPFMDSWQKNIVSQSDSAIIWRRFILSIAGYHCQHLDGDFVECGAYEGVGAKTVIDYLGGPNFSKKFWLYDIFEHSSEMENHAMPNHGPQLYEQVLDRFSSYPNVEIIKGFIPNSFSINKPEKIAYLHIDLNQVTAEIACLDHLFDRVVPGGIIIFDDYEMLAYNAQKVAEDKWLDNKGYKVFALPTSQGLVIKR
jgi:protein O-GlcNAc transferase